MQFENSNVLKSDERAKIVHEVKTRCAEYGVDPSGILSLQMNHRMQTTAGQITWQWLDSSTHSMMSFRGRGRRRKSSVPQNVRWAVLKFSVRLYREFGFEHMMGTVRHELAHFICLVKYGEPGHGTLFKDICLAIGGHMNKRMAGQNWKEAGTDKYCKSRKNWRYTCKCRTRETTRRYKAHTLKRYYCTGCKQYRSEWKLERI